jgi:hypothetical protein
MFATPAQAGIFSSIFSWHTNPLIEAAKSGDLTSVNNLISQGSYVNAQDASGNTALHLAAQHGDTQMVQTLIRAGAEVNMANDDGETALHVAAKNGQPDIAKTLMKNGANPNLADKHGLTAFQEAINAKNINVAQVIDPAGLTAVSSDASFPVVIAAAAAGGGGVSTTTIVAAGGVAAAAGGVAAAAGGGGGGGSSGSSSGGGGGSGGGGDGGSGGGGNNGGGGGSSGGSGGSGGTDSFTTEYNTQGGLAQIKASAAYARGYTGSGITIAIIDTGVDLTHPDLQANILSNSANCIGSNGNVNNCTVNTAGGSVGNDDAWHGTHVAGIAAAARNGFGVNGVAYNAKILAVKAMDSHGSGDSDDIAAGINYATNNGAKVINLSLGGSTINGVNPFPDITASISNAMNHNVMVFAAAGNDSGTDPIWPARNAATLNGTIATGSMIAVGSVDSSNVISSFSNHCGTTKNWCLVAPGESITSTTPSATVGFDYGYTSGTSMATPQVSGAAAVLLEEFGSSGATPRQVAQRLLDTATDLGAAGVDDVYGHGLLNLDKATDPLGTTSIPTGNIVGGASFTVSSSSITTAAAFGDALSRSNLQLTMLDSYNWAYNISLASLTHNSDSFKSFDDMFSAFGNSQLDNTINVSENMSLSFDDTPDAKPYLNDDEQSSPTGRMSLHASLQNSDITMNYNIAMDQAFTPSVLNGTSSAASENVSRTSFLSFIDKGMSYLNEYKLTETSKVRLGSFYGDSENGVAFGFVNDFTTKFDKANFGLQMGMVNEENSFLGSRADGAFAIANTTTWFSNISADIPLGNKFSLIGSYNYGISYAEAGADSLVANMSGITSDSFKFGINKKDSLKKDDKIDFVISQPLRANSGSAELNLPLARDADGNIYRGSYDVSLAPKGREIDFGLFYSQVINPKASINTGLMYRLEPGNVENAEPDTVLMAEYKIKLGGKK